MAIGITPEVGNHGTDSGLDDTTDLSYLTNLHTLSLGDHSSTTLCITRLTSLKNIKYTSTVCSLFPHSFPNQLESLTLSRIYNVWHQPLPNLKRLRLKPPDRRYAHFTDLAKNNPYSLLNELILDMAPLFSLSLFTTLTRLTIRGSCYASDYYNTLQTMNLKGLKSLESLECSDLFILSNTFQNPLPSLTSLTIRNCVIICKPSNFLSLREGDNVIQL